MEQAGEASGKSFVEVVVQGINCLAWKQLGERPLTKTSKEEALQNPFCLQVGVLLMMTEVVAARRGARINVEEPKAGR